MAAALRWAASRYSFVEEEVAAIGEFVAPGDVCLDIGAEYGLYTWTLAALAGPSGWVHSVEPLPGPARWLSTCACLLGCRNVIVHRTALGARPGHGTLSLPRRRGLPVHGRAFLTQGASGPGPNSEFRTSRPVRTTVLTLDQLVGRAGIEKLSFVKADVEGAELAVLAGGQETLRRCRPTLLLEIESRHLDKYGARPADVVSHLQDFGYGLHRQHRGRWVESSRITDDCRNYLFAS
ncbi:FkbM family methyltransferase [Streptomyces paradoxus]|uniref:FkbM family methyltransferase n=1 Tax=Streptomyces paradoxus TaxID=66375 RepID=A0A7W9WFI7_9ACTN|nr:FkbM family methyltransferase [Streptomyces paradoxus]MBB6075109.1 FkbM family methyltransferase [Streptomyces paradoxus]